MAGALAPKANRLRRAWVPLLIGVLMLSSGCGGGGTTDGREPAFDDVPAGPALASSLEPETLLNDAVGASTGDGALVLELLPDVVVDLAGVAVVDGFTGRTVVADVIAPAPGEAYVTVSGGVGSGSVRVGATYYLLESTGEGPFQVRELAASDFPPESPIVVPESLSQRNAVTLLQPASNGVSPRERASARHDLLVVYTQALGTPARETVTLTAIDRAAAQANRAYRNSGIDLELDVVGALKLDYASSGDTGTDLDRLKNTNDGFMDEVHAERDRLGADLVILLSPAFNGCGRANLAVVNSDADDDSAFGVVDINCIGFQTMTHELGHISGAYHDKAADPLTSPFTRYAHGYVDPGGPWRTVMAYPDACGQPRGGCPRINHFSDESRTNPADGRATGTDGLNNARRIAETAITLENFRLQGPRISLYEGNGGSQDHVCVIDIASDRSVDFTDSSDRRFCDNDEARSLTLFDVPAGRVVRLFDSPNGDREDDWTEIVALEDIDELTIDSFEIDLAGRRDVRVTTHPNNGLDGKVSRVEVGSSPSGPFVDLHEGNGGTQNLVCALPIGQPVDVDFQVDGDCDNDEARSLTLRDVPAGTVLTLYDDPGGRRDDDWTEIVVLAPISSLTVDSFERNLLDDSRVRVVHHPDNGLDGKVSRLEVGFERAGAIVDLHEGNNGTQNLVCSLGVGQARSIDLTRDGQCDNDEARSLTLYDVPAGTVIALFDDPGGNREDDWTSIEVLRDVSVRTIGSFETDVEDDEVRVLSFRDNGIDGKVSRVEIDGSTPAGGILTFHEGNGGTQNKVCDVEARAGVYRFKSLSACDNDETRSVTLTLVRAGTRIEVYDDPDCRRNDDWTEIVVKRSVSRRTVDTYERSFSDEALDVVHRRDNGLDGKVSCVRVSGP